MLAALAEATVRVEIGTLVLCNSFRNPAVLAKMATAIDEISNGRLILGLGSGWNEPEYRAFGLPFDHRVDRFEEALQIVKPLLREGHVDFEGT
jgi:alkanesulfonate monooxygenase SsuD/methylene tetrahydromethanopterin reductase-like flavin-dependent oxidoreductase (luciferase family)